MRILIAAGGTGGHVYPALAVAEAMARSNPDATLDFAGARGGFERPLVEQSGVAFAAYHEVMAGPLHGVNPLRVLASLLKLFVGLFQSLVLLIQRRPNAILLTGGWANVPLAVGAWMLRIPSLVYLPDIEPGLTIRVVRRFATRVALTVPDSAQYFPGSSTVVTGYPLRYGLRSAARQDAIAHFGLDPQRKTLMVMGGSQGARSINIAVIDILPDLLAAGIQVIHIVGPIDRERAQAQAAPISGAGCYHAFPYLHDDIGLAFTAADLIVCRSGASTLGELPFFGVPSILVPYPYAWRYQRVNADYLAERGAAIRMDDDKMAAELWPTIRSLFDDPARLAAMRAAAKALAQPDGAARVAQALAGIARR